MIGDWVKTPKGNRQVEELSTKNCLLNWQDYGCTLDDIEPIPLTEDIFKANNFRKSGSVFCFADDYYDIIAFELSDSIWKVILHNNEISLSDEQVFVSYVHQLQNFLNICGVEKEIEL